MLLRDDQGGTLRLGSRLGGGGEGSIFAVEGQPHLAAKVYHRVTAGQEGKLRAMIRHPPALSGGATPSICWPRRILFERAAGPLVGFLMPRIDTRTHVPLLKLYNPTDRLNTLPGFTWGYLVRAAINISSMVHAIHAGGYVIGDLNESNFLVSREALAVLVDCDSMQVSSGGRHFYCPVGKPELTPPELQGRSLEGTLRTRLHDQFALGVLLFQMLMEGVHPFGGRWREGMDPPPEERIRRGACPYTGSTEVAPASGALPFRVLPARLRTLFTRCFREGHSQPHLRPSAAEWHAALVSTERRLKTCGSNGQHRHARWGRCPWCQRTRLLGRDPFPPLEQRPPQHRRTVTPKPAGRPAPSDARHAALASRWARLGACFLDDLIFVCVWASGAMRGPLGGALLPCLLLGQLALLQWRGQTLGKLALGIKIVRPDRSKASLGRILLLRMMTSAVPGLAFGGSEVGIHVLAICQIIDALMIFSASRTCLHDRIADTIVVRSR